MTEPAVGGPGRFVTRGQPVAVDAVRAMVASGVPHAILLVGPASAGKTTLAYDLAAALLCLAPDPAARPCRACRGCRLVAAGNHPDLHRLAPEGAGRQIAIGDARHPDPGTVRHLVGELALLPVEGGARVAVVEEAVRMNEDAQNALLKTLEEPPEGVAILLCADDEDRLLPTVRSRCARIRLGSVGVRDIEELLAEQSLADPPTAARLARISGGRPGLAVALARAPEAVAARQEIGRSLLDALAASRARRLSLVRELAARAAELVAALSAPGPSAAEGVAPGGRRRSSGRGQRGTSKVDAAVSEAPVARGEPGFADPGAADSDGPGPGDRSDETTIEASAGSRAAASDRRRAALALLDVWRDVARDLTLVASGSRAGLRDPGLLDDLDVVARDVDARSVAAHLARIERAGLLLEGNANPELVLDVLVLAWPHAGESR